MRRIRLQAAQSFHDLLPAAHQHACKENQKEQCKIKSTVIPSSTCPGIGADLGQMLSVLQFKVELNPSLVCSCVFNIFNSLYLTDDVITMKKR